MTVFYKDPSELFKNFHIFWPAKGQSSGERTNATVRFIIYSSLLIYLFNRDVRVFALAAVAILIVSIMSVNNLIQERMQPSCVRGTAENPMGNFLMSDYSDRPDRPAACGSVKEMDAQEKLLAASFPQDSGDFWGRRSGANRFYTMPNTQAANNREKLLSLSFGSQMSRVCRDGSQYCSIDNNFSRNPDNLWTRAGGGGGTSNGQIY